MLIKSILKIWLWSVDFEKFTFITLDGTITALQTLDCDWSPHNFIEVNFSKLTDSNQIFRIDFDCIHFQMQNFCSL